MNTLRSYNCKNEELPVICKFAAFNLNRDLPDFSDYSPRFSAEYLEGFKAKINVVSELVEPKSEIMELKLLNEQLYKRIDELITPINFLTGYINMANGQLKLSPADFGLATLRKGIVSKDVESVIRSLQTVNANITKHKSILAKQGLKDELVDRFTGDAIQIAADKQTQYEMLSNRKNLVQTNQSLLNELFDQLNEILSTGKTLYKKVDLAKQKGYTFNELKKRVRKTSKPDNGTAGEPTSEPEV